MSENRSHSPGGPSGPAWRAELSADARTSSGINFQVKASGLASAQVWEYDAGTNRRCPDVAGDAARALSAPDDFPPIDAAIVDGDKVVLAVDPNVPNVDEVIQGVIRVMRSTPASQIEIVVWDEATDETLGRIRAVATGLNVIEHRSDNRETLSYLAADVDAEPIYLNRALVDADFVRAARAKGVTEFRILTRHALRNALVPVLTLAGVIFPALVSGAVLVERIFAWPGMGRAVVDAVVQRDYPLVGGAVLLTSLAVVAGTILADLAVAWADPRRRS